MLLVGNSAKPEAVSATVIMTRPATVALYEGRGTEVFEAGAWGREKLARAIVTGACVLLGIREKSY